MYLVRRVVRTKPGKAWYVANILMNICAAYEKQGRAKATVYVGGVPSDPDVAYVEWTQDVIKPSDMPNIPQSVFDDDAKMRPHLLTYDLEFYEVVTSEKLSAKGIS